MNKNKYYKVKEIKNASGQIDFKVFACESVFKKFFGLWSEYTKTHETHEEAVNHVERLVSMKIIKEEIVYKRNV